MLYQNFNFFSKYYSQQTFNFQAIINDKEKDDAQRGCVYLFNVNLQQNYVSPLFIFNIFLHNHKKCLVEKYSRLNNYPGKNWHMNFI